MNQIAGDRTKEFDFNILAVHFIEKRSFLWYYKEQTEILLIKNNVDFVTSTKPIKITRCP